MIDSANKSEPMRGKCLVLGGRGFIGSHLVEALLAQGYSVRSFDRPNVTSPLHGSHLKHPNFELCEGDFVSEAEVASALEGCDFCYHLVSTTLPKSSNADPVFDIESNVLGSVRLLTHAVRLGLKKVIFVSSGGTVYGVPKSVPVTEDHPTDPICSYGITKLAIEKYLQLFYELHGLDYAVLRLANPFGEGQRLHASQGAVAVFLGKILIGEPVEIWGDGSVVRDFIYISDVVDALLAALVKTEGERIFNIGSGRGHSLNELIRAIEKVTGRVADCRYLPGRAFDIPSNVLCNARASQGLGWSPEVGFEEGLEKFVTWLLNHPEKNA
ncbi:NAD-dependent epimerase/dehydratase family protein [Uliginosibacterium sp. 31-16]|uniref:NAD-dependent epimerase/dehydratase family protein n=1 Tax=Uliginosibacterium sp. 31-16 TaxID=3068315 RepID=UPI00273EAC6B|nr:NAD-dependent epimerase/dehydratase family protein [Uliginosibacterium sp. 31-16]MDP5238449.1 NAD-dependent epimerase/dehydratase family protein [Uliginosibacterium sp. 31-16]